ncbi:MAG TPA: trehalose-phosphatase [Anaeromyxobacteraceae bacterium]|nr:trehalose-phosphatase [Anaeromyxobacteraceae bacterium]
MAAPFPEHPVIPILSPTGAAAIDAIARRRTFLAFDFDGTLAPFQDDRRHARMRDGTRDLLRAASLLYPCAVISGRTRADVAARVADVPLAAVVGNHGAEPGFGPLDERLARRVAIWREGLERALAGAEGVELEDKRFSIALHYRASRHPEAARARIGAAVTALEGAQSFEGHAVVNVLPDDAPTKGDAIEALAARFGARLAVYVGDDRTDEEAFRSGVVEVSIRVGAGPGTAATHGLPDQTRVDDLLRALVAARARLDGRRWEGLVRAVAR